MARLKSSATINQQSIFAIVETPLPEWLRVDMRCGNPEIKAFIKQWVNARMFALDIETYSNTDTTDGALDPWLGEIRLVQIGLRDGSVMIFDLGGYDDDREAIAQRLTKLGFFDALKQTVSSKRQRTIGHNLNFDLGWILHKFGIAPWYVGDTMLMSQIYWAGISTYRHSLKATAGRLGIEIDKTEQTSNWGFPLVSSQLLYAGLDVRNLFPVYLELAKLCEVDGLLPSVNAEFAALPAFVEMMETGMPVDEPTLDDVLAKYKTAYETISAPFFAAFPGYSIHETATAKSAGREDGNLIAALGKRLGIHVEKCDKDALGPYRDNPIIGSLLAAKSAKAYVNYLQGVKDSLRDCAVRGGYRQCAPQGRGRSTSGGGDGETESSTGATKTGVPSVNLQNPPNPTKMCAELRGLDLPSVRSIFRAPPGYAMGGTDYSAAHARIAAQTTKDKAFIASYNDDIDIHCVVAAKLSWLVGKRWTESQLTKIRKEKTDDGGLATRLRNTAKNVFYGWLNGAGAAKTAETIGLGGYPCELDFAKEVISLLNDAFPGIKAYHDAIKKLIKLNPVFFTGCKLPYVGVAGISGRRVWLPVWPTNDKGYGGAKPTDALMVAWMTVESDAKKMAMGLVRIEAEKHPEWKLRLINDCHDELDWISLEEYFNDAGAAVWLAMQSALAYFVTVISVCEGPFEPSEPTHSWDECK